jgi:hypothetical protein
MRELINLVFRLTWAMPLIALKQFMTALAPESSRAAQPVSAPAPGAPAGGAASSAEPAPSKNENPYGISMVVVGEGLAAGVGDFSISAETQPWSFPAQMARQMGVDLPQRLIQAPGLDNGISFGSLPVLMPSPLQSTVVGQLPPGPVANLALPAFTLEDALHLRPRQPLVHRGNSKQTAVNLTWGLLPMAQGRDGSPTQIECALQQSPNLVLIELGYYEAVRAAVACDPELVPEIGVFISRYRQIVQQLSQSNARILAINVPDPLDTAYFATVTEAAQVLKVDPAFLTSVYSMAPDDVVTVIGLNEIGYQLFARTIAPLPPGSTLSSETARSLSDRVASINQGLSGLAAEQGLALYDLAGLFRRIAREGHPAGGRILNGGYLGGFYSLNGCYPGQTGQAIIANEILALLSRTLQASFPLIDLNAVMSSDPVAAYRPAPGPSWTIEQLQQAAAQKAATAPEPAPPKTPDARPGSDWGTFAETPQTALPLQLPPGLEQVLPLNTDASYFGDGISPVNGRDPLGIQWGSTGNFLFGGLAMVDSHLSGSIRIRFSPPVDGVTQFQADYMGGFTGEDSVLATPQYFKMGFQQNRVDAVPSQISSGSLNLETGEVSNLSIHARYSSTALFALVSVNPTFPPPFLTFPGQYGSAWASFAQRPDGKLDFSFYGSTFVPLGKDIVWPLNFTGPSLKFATIPAAGTVMHPHLSLSTKAPAFSPEDAPPDIPYNTIQEFTLFTHNSAFGDAFNLKVAALGGRAKGRSHLLGRLQVQFGGRTGNSVPVAVWALAPGGALAPLPVSPITQVFPGRLFAGPQGFNENLRFPLRSYPLDDLSILDDPFDISVGAIDLRSGRCLNDLLHRAFISQDLIFALLRVEPRTPKDSFYFRGPALLARDSREQSVFRFQGIVHIPYPPGFQFPHPDFTTAFTVGADSALDPFLWFHAIQSEEIRDAVMEGGAEDVRSSTGDVFSYRYVVPADPAREKPVFEYHNHSQQGSFVMHSMAWVDFGNSGTSHADGRDGHDYDTVSFTGFGVWRKDGVNTLQQASVQISTSAVKPYVGIQIASGDVSNVNTKPQDEPAALP